MTLPLQITRQPSAHLRGLVHRVVGYAERGAPIRLRETASLIFPVIFSFGTPWRISLADGADQRAGSFASGLFPGPVGIVSDGGAACVQVDLTPRGAARLFGGAAADLAGALVDLDVVPGFGAAARALSARLAETSDWQSRLTLAEDFIANRLVHQDSAQIQAAWRCLAQGLSVADTANHIGWSSRYLSTRFRQETGLRPVSALRILRFQRAIGLAEASDPAGWAMIAAEAGYADQAHLIRDFRCLAGDSPTGWARSTMRSAAGSLASIAG